MIILITKLQTSYPMINGSKMKVDTMTRNISINDQNYNTNSYQIAQSTQIGKLPLSYMYMGCEKTNFNDIIISLNELKLS